MSLINVDKIDPQSGTALEVGTSGDTVTVPSGVGLTLTDSTLLLPTTIQTDKLDPKSGTDLELGSSGDTITIPSGATITNSGTATGFGGNNTPSFLAYVGSAQNPSDATVTDVEIDTEVFDTDSCFNTGTYTFTPTTAGKYLLFCAVRVGGGTTRPAFIEMQARIRKNGGNCANQLLSSYSNSDLDAFNIPITTIVEANGSSDAFKVDAYLDLDSGTIEIYSGQTQTYFGGYKLIGV